MPESVWAELEEVRRGAAVPGGGMPARIQTRTPFGRDVLRGRRGPGPLIRQELPSQKRSKQGAATARELAAARGRGEEARAISAAIRSMGLDASVVGSILASTEPVEDKPSDLPGYNGIGTAYDAIANALIALTDKANAADAGALEAKVFQGARYVVYTRGDVLEKLKRGGAAFPMRGDVERVAARLMSAYLMSGYQIASMGDGARQGISAVTREGLESAITAVMQAAPEHQAGAQTQAQAEVGDEKADDDEDGLVFDMSDPVMANTIVVSDEDWSELVDEYWRAIIDIFPDAGSEARQDPSDPEDSRFDRLIGELAQTFDSFFGGGAVTISALFLTKEIPYIAVALAKEIVDSMRTLIRAGNVLDEDSAIDILDEFLQTGWAFQGGTVSEVIITDEPGRYYLPGLGAAMESVRPWKRRSTMGAIGRFERLVEVRRQAAGAGDPFKFRAHPWSKDIGGFGRAPTVSAANPFGAPIDVPDTMQRQSLPSELEFIKQQQTAVAQKQQVQQIAMELVAKVRQSMKVGGFQGNVERYLKLNEPIDKQLLATASKNAAGLVSDQGAGRERVAELARLAKANLAAVPGQIDIYRQDLIKAARVEVYNRTDWIGSFEPNPGKRGMTVFQAEALAVFLSEMLFAAITNPQPPEAGERANDLATKDRVKEFYRDAKDTALDALAKVTRVSLQQPTTVATAPPATATTAAPPAGQKLLTAPTGALPARGTATLAPAAPTAPTEDPDALTPDELAAAALEAELASEDDARAEQEKMYAASRASYAARLGQQHAAGGEAGDEGSEEDGGDITLMRGDGFNAIATLIYQSVAGGTLDASAPKRVSGLLRSIARKASGGKDDIVVDDSVAPRIIDRVITWAEEGGGDPQQLARSVGNVLADAMGEELTKILAAAGVLSAGARVTIESRRASHMGSLKEVAASGLRQLAEIRNQGGERIPSDEQPRLRRMPTTGISIEDAPLEPEVKDALRGFVAIREAIVEFEREWEETPIQVPGVTHRRLPSGRLSAVNPAGLSGKQWEGVTKEIEKSISGALKALDTEVIRVDDTLLKLEPWFRTTMDADQVISGLPAELEKRLAASVDPTAGYTGGSASIARKAVAQTLAAVNQQLKAALLDLEKLATKQSEGIRLNAIPRDIAGGPTEAIDFGALAGSVGAGLGRLWRGLGSLIKSLWDKLAGVRSAVDAFVEHAGTIAGEAIGLPPEALANTSYDVRPWYGDRAAGHDTPWTAAQARYAGKYGESGERPRRRRRARATGIPTFTDVAQQLARGVPLSHFLDQG